MCIWETQHKCQERCRGRRAPIKSQKRRIRVKRDLFESKKTCSSQNTPPERHPESRRDAMGVVHKSKVKRDLFKSKHTTWETSRKQERCHGSCAQIKSQKRPIQVKRDLFKSKETYLSQKRPGVVHKWKVKRDLFKSKETYSSQKRSHERHPEMSGEMPGELCMNQKSKETYSSQKY